MSAPSRLTCRARHWLARSLANRYMAAATALTVLAALVVGAASYVAIYRLILASAQDSLESHSRLAQQHLSQDLNVIAADLAAMAGNAFIANGLVDSGGRENYLQPFLRDHKSPVALDVGILLTDFRGRPLIGNRPLDQIALPEMPELRQALGTGRRRASLVAENGQAVLYLLQPVIFPPTGQSEGLLVARIDLDELFATRMAALGAGFHGELHAAGRLVVNGPADDTADHAIHSDLRLGLAPPLDALDLSLWLHHERPRALGLLGLATAAYLALALSALVAVAALARLTARRITAPLVALSKAAATVTEHTLPAVQFPVAVQDEVGRLGASFNAMLARLGESQAQLEARVAERTRELAGEVAVRREAEERAQEALAEREALLREVHHRVKNNLAVIASLIGLQAGDIADAATRRMLAELQERVRVMALVHEHLYRSSSLARVDFKAYLETLTREIVSTRDCGSQVRLDLEVTDAALDIEQAIPCGMIVNELLSNAYKYAFPPARLAAGGCAVRVTLSRAAEGLALTVADNGVGLPQETDWRSADTLGLRLVQALARQIGARVALRGEGGTQFTFSFKERT